MTAVITWLHSVDCLERLNIRYSNVLQRQFATFCSVLNNF